MTATVSAPPPSCLPRCGSGCVTVQNTTGGQQGRATGCTHCVVWVSPGLPPLVSLLTSAGDLVKRLKHHQMVTRDVAWHPYLPLVFTTSWDGTHMAFDYQEPPEDLALQPEVITTRKRQRCACAQIPWDPRRGKQSMPCTDSRRLGFVGVREGTGYGRPVDRGVWTAKTVKRPRQQPAHSQYANYWAPLTRKQHTMPHPGQPRHTNDWAPRTRKRHQQEHRPQRPTESNDPTQHAKGRSGDCPGPRKETTTRRNVTRGAQPWYTNDRASRTGKQRQQEHRPQRPSERSAPTQHAEGQTGECPGPRKETTTRRNVTRGGCCSMPM